MTQEERLHICRKCINYRCDHDDIDLGYCWYHECDFEMINDCPKWHGKELDGTNNVGE